MVPRRQTCLYFSVFYLLKQTRSYSNLSRQENKLLDDRVPVVEIAVMILSPMVTFNMYFANTTWLILPPLSVGERVSLPPPPPSLSLSVSESVQEEWHSVSHQGECLHSLRGGYKCSHALWGCPGMIGRARLAVWGLPVMTTPCLRTPATGDLSRSSTDFPKQKQKLKNGTLRKHFLATVNVNLSVWWGCLTVNA